MDVPPPPGLSPSEPPPGGQPEVIGTWNSTTSGGVSQNTPGFATGFVGALDVFFLTINERDAEGNLVTVEQLQGRSLRAHTPNGWQATFTGTVANRWDVGGSPHIELQPGTSVGTFPNGEVLTLEATD